MTTCPVCEERVPVEEFNECDLCGLEVCDRCLLVVPLVQWCIVCDAEEEEEN